MKLSQLPGPAAVLVTLITLVLLVGAVRLGGSLSDSFGLDPAGPRLEQQRRRLGERRPKLALYREDR